MGVSNGGMLKTFRRAFTATEGNLHPRKPTMALSPTPPVCDQNSSSVLAVSSSGSPLDLLNLPLSVSSGRPVRCSGDSLSLGDEEFDWVSVDRGEADADVLTGDAPWFEEVQDAFSALGLMLDVDTNADAEDQVLRSEDVISSGVLADGCEFGDWTEPPLQLCNARILQLQPFLQDRLFDAFHLLQTDPSIQRMVVSLASDRAVCDAVMNNEVVRELITNVEYHLESSDESPEDSGSATDFIKRLFERSATKITDAIERITKYVTDLFKIHGDEASTTVMVTAAAPVMEKLQMTVLLAIVVLLIVLVTRAMKA